MLYSVRGTIIHKETGLAVIECGGAGYGCRITNNTLSRLGEIGAEGMLYTYLHITQDGIMFFGFYDRQELGCFKMLLSVTGVGPKAALAILSDIDPNSFALAVATGNHKLLTKTKGVGPKMAQRIVLELKDKISKEQLAVSEGRLSQSGNVPVQAGAASEAVEALMVLGYSQTEAEDAVSKSDPSLSAEELIRLSLKSLARFK